MHYSYVEIEYVATSISPARTDLAPKLVRTQNTVKDKTSNSLKSMGQTNKHEGLNLMFANHGNRMDYTVLVQ
jgi:hypothetical protein